MNKILGKRKLVRDISANTLQTGITQIFGLIIFYVTSKYLSKGEFGEFNWSMAVGSTMIAVASLGLDLVFVKRVASGEDVLTISGIHLFHTVIAGATLCVLAFSVNYFYPAFNENHPVFFMVFISLAIANIGNSFKLCLNGLEAYRQLAILSFCTNVLKLALIIVVYCYLNFTLFQVVMAYMAASLFELCAGYYLMGRSISARVKPLLKVVEYKYFILESLTQMGVVLFDSALARIDWILLGVISTAQAGATIAAITAEYSFTYKVFELSKLPLLIIGPVLLTRFSKLFSHNKTINEKSRQEILFFFKLQSFLVLLIPIVLICTWSPLIDYFTNNKYGAVNEQKYWILAACIPLHSLINFLWTVSFVQGQLKTIMFITIMASLLNIAANFFLIPLYNGMGAAWAFLISTLFQALLYLKYTKQEQLRVNLQSASVILLNAAAGVIVARVFIDKLVLSALVALLIFVLLTILTGQLSYKQVRNSIRP
jgi:O-antigen/teichoic acid export membrane protein